MPDHPDSSVSRRKLDILIIENDPAAVLLTKEAFREAGLTECVYSVPDGDEALAVLKSDARVALNR